MGRCIADCTKRSVGFEYSRYKKYRLQCKDKERFDHDVRTFKCFREFGFESRLHGVFLELSGFFVVEFILIELKCVGSFVMAIEDQCEEN